MKNIIKHIIFLSVLLLFSCVLQLSYVFAEPLPTSSFSNNFSKENSTKEDFGCSFETDSIASTPVKDLYKKKELVVDNEEEDSESVSSKKHSEITNYFISFLSYKKPKFFYYHFNNSFASCKEFFYLPSYTSLYIIFEVFRI